MIWEDPPPFHNGGQNRRKDADEIVAELKEHPGRWALVPASDDRDGGKVYKRRGAEVATRRRQDGRRDIYVRWPEEVAA